MFAAKDLSTLSYLYISENLSLLYQQIEDEDVGGFHILLFIFYK